MSEAIMPAPRAVARVQPDSTPGGNIDGCGSWG